jgi:peptide/nickel transport system substrate-binding protein
MNARKMCYSLMTVLVLLSVLLSACAQTPTQAPTQAPAEPATQAPQDPPADSEAAAPTQAPEPTAIPEPTQVEMLRIAIAKDEASANPYTYVTGYPGWYIMMWQYDTLYQMDEQGVPKPWLATEVTTEDGGLNYAITLRDDVTWHDGTAFTAKDVKFAFDYYTEKKVGRFSRDLRIVESVEVVDDTHLAVKMTGPNPSFAFQVLIDVPILPEHIWKDVADPKVQEFETNVGTGPYKLVEHKADQYYRFVSNDAYFAGKPLV